MKKPNDSFWQIIGPFFGSVVVFWVAGVVAGVYIAHAIQTSVIGLTDIVIIILVITLFLLSSKVMMTTGSGQPLKLPRLCRRHR